MNPVIVEFQKRAAAVGLTEAQINAFLTTNKLGDKVAEPTFADVLAQLCVEANVEKTAEAVSYAEGFLTKAGEAGLTIDQAVSVTKQALARTFPAVQQQKTAEEQDPQKLAYTLGLYEKAAELGMNEAETADFLKQAGAFDWLRSAGQAVGSAGRSAVNATKGLANKVQQAGPKLLGFGAGAGLGAAGRFGLDKLTQPGLAENLLSLIKNNPELAGALGGAGAGGLAGGLSGLPGESDPNNPAASQSHVGRNALLGALAGGGIGAGAGHFAPDMFKQLAA